MRYRRPNLVSTLVDGKVEHTLEGWFEDPEWTRLRGEVLSDLPILGLRVVTIAETASLVETLKTEKKKALQRDIDVEMADANQPDFRNIAEMVAEAVKKEVAKKGPANLKNHKFNKRKDGNGEGSSKKKTSPSNDNRKPQGGGKPRRSKGRAGKPAPGNAKGKGKGKA
ncbi:hypothetical protein H0H81_007710 [Sphagnurus paluster]|uniref:Uncharacterized protein n=1 Tax=Sphagnurus paluster TaxID=117069 RepID=A0A9P7KFE9_9AGAR|nr:hypothetical protein H0H81_007710 [Sphagnurus paluster]